MLEEAYGRRWTNRIVAVGTTLIALMALVSFLTLHTVHGRRPDMIDGEGRVTAPDFPAKAEWLNADRGDPAGRGDRANQPLTLEALRGKVVLLDFWTYCCINCMHVIADLKRLEAKYADELVVVGVHSAKFTAESQTDNTRQAILRYGIEHPVINDRNMILWREYGIRAWPSFVLIDPAGKIAGYASGEGVYEQFDGAIAKVIAAFDAKGLIDRTPLTFALERDRAPRSVLSFPGKVLAHEASAHGASAHGASADGPSKQLFIADSGHNRIVVVSLDDSSVKAVIGSGAEGFADGNFETARFNHPQGLAFDGRVLYVADTDNHAIRRADLETKTVETIAGTGEQARRFNVAGPGKTTALNSPWDLVLHEGALYIAMAGSHQLWRLDLASGRVEPYAGTGREDRTDGRLASAALAQPSGLTTDGTKLYFADSEVSAIRSADLDPRGRVETIVGGELFKFGDVDGRGLAVRLQHPLGIAYHDGALYVADTYNNKIKRVTLSNRTASTLLGTGKAGHDDGETPTFDEPGGVSIADGKLYIADTNNHAIRVADLETRRVETLQIADPRVLWMPEETPVEQEARVLPEQQLKPGKATVTVTLALPEGCELNAEAPSALSIVSSDVKVLTLNGGDAHEIERPAFPIEVAVDASPGSATLRVTYALYYCAHDKESLCYLGDGVLALPITISDAATNSHAAVEIAITRQH